MSASANANLTDRIVGWCEDDRILYPRAFVFIQSLLIAWALFALTLSVLIVVGVA